MAVKVLSTFSLLSFVIAVAVVMTGQTNQIENLVSPYANVTPGTKEYDRTPAGRAEVASSDQTLDALSRVAVLAATSNPDVTEKELVTELAGSEPQAKVGEPLDEEGTVVRLRKPKLAEICIKPAGYRCAVVDLTNHAGRGTASGTSLAAARKAAAVQVKPSADKRRPGSGGRQRGGGSIEDSSGGGNTILDRARKLPGAGR